MVSSLSRGYANLCIVTIFSIWATKVSTLQLVLKINPVDQNVLWFLQSVFYYCNCWCYYILLIRKNQYGKEEHISLKNKSKSPGSGGRDIETTEFSSSACSSLNSHITWDETDLPQSGHDKLYPLYCRKKLNKRKWE